MIALDADRLRSLPLAEQFVLLTVLTAAQDGASHVEFRLGDGWALVYQRSDGRDWELLPPPDELVPELKAAVRNLGKLVSPDRPERTFTVAPPGATVELPEVGWLTVGIDGEGFDSRVEIEPTEPGGHIRFSFDAPAPASVSDLLNDYHAADADA